MAKSIKSILISVFVLIFTLSSSVLAFADDLRVPDWVSVTYETNNTATVSVTTPDDMQGQIDYYETSQDGGKTWTVLANPLGGQFVINQSCEFIVRYTKDNVTSDKFSVTISISTSVSVTDSSTGISIIISPDSEIPTDISISAFQIISGLDYNTIKEVLENKSFNLYNVTVMRNNSVFHYDGEYTWIFPIDGLDASYCKLYYIGSSGVPEIVESEQQLNSLYCSSSFTGYYAVVEDKAYMKGDVNGDSVITASDARTALRASAELETLTEIQFTAADYNNDGVITAADARGILILSAKI